MLAGSREQPWSIIEPGGALRLVPPAGTSPHARKHYVGTFGVNGLSHPNGEIAPWQRIRCVMLWIALPRRGARCEDALDRALDALRHGPQRVVLHLDLCPGP